MPVPHWPDFCGFIILSFEIRKDKSSNSALFQDVLDISDPLNVYVNFRVSLSISAKNPSEILMEIAPNVQINLGSTAILTIASLPIHGHELFYHLFKLSLIFFQ